MDGREALVALLEACRHEYYLVRNLQHNPAAPFDPNSEWENIESDDSEEPKPSVNKISRSAAAHAALVDALQTEFCADDLDPPDDSIYWTEETLRAWFEEGGVITTRVLRQDTVRALDVDIVLGELPRLPFKLMERLSESSMTILTALQQRDADAFGMLASRFASDGWAACRIGLAPELWRRARDEGSTAWPLMRPNHVTRPDGRRLFGRAPSGAKRGDRYIMAQTLPGGSESYPVLTSLDELVATVGAALAPHLASNADFGELQLVGASHVQCAIFPGDGGKYGAHFDGDGLTTRMTMIVYTSSDWQEADGGELCVLDEKERCWRALPPREDTLLIFRSESVLHQVRPSYAGSRLALTAFFTVGRGQKQLLATARNADRYLEQDDAEY